MTEAFSEEGIEKLKERLKESKDVVLTFNQDGKLKDYKIKLEKGKIFGRDVTTVDPETVQVVKVKRGKK